MSFRSSVFSRLELRGYDPSAPMRWDSWGWLVRAAHRRGAEPHQSRVHAPGDSRSYQTVSYIPPPWRRILWHSSQRRAPGRHRGGHKKPERVFSTSDFFCCAHLMSCLFTITKLFAYCHWLSAIALSLMPSQSVFPQWCDILLSSRNLCLSVSVIVSLKMPMSSQASLRGVRITSTPQDLCVELAGELEARRQGLSEQERGALVFPVPKPPSAAEIDARESTPFPSEPRCKFCQWASGDRSVICLTCLKIEREKKVCCSWIIHFLKATCERTELSRKLG